MVLEFIEGYILKMGVAPSFQEIKDHFGFASYNSVQRYLKQLQEKGYIHAPGGNKKRAIQILRPSNAYQNAVKHLQEDILRLPLLGQVAAGAPIEAHEYNEYIEVPPGMISSTQNSYALKVNGQSMIEDGIFDGDVLLVKEKLTAQNGEIVIANIDNEYTVKRFYLHENKKTAPQVELRPANSQMDSFWYDPHQVEVRGVILGLIRKY